MKDICLGCGNEYKKVIWGADCMCGKSNVVHQQACNGCGKIIGFMIDDDYCGLKKLYCPECMDKARRIEKED